MKTKEVIWVSNPSYIIGKYKVIVNDSISIETHNALSALLQTALEVRNGDKDATCKFFVTFIAFYMLLPVQVTLVPHAFVD